MRRPRIQENVGELSEAYILADLDNDSARRVGCCVCVSVCVSVCDINALWLNA